MWQTSVAKAMGIRTHPCVGVGSIATVRALFEPSAQKVFIADLVAAVQVSESRHMATTWTHALQ